MSLVIEVVEDKASYLNWDNSAYVSMIRGSILRIINPNDKNSALFPKGRSVFSCHINKLGLCCGVRELALFASWNGLNTNPELAAETVACIKKALVDHAVNKRWSLAHLTLTKKNQYIYETEWGGSVAPINQPQWFVNMLNEWEGATHSEWIKNRNTSNDLQMWTLPIK